MTTAMTTTMTTQRNITADKGAVAPRRHRLKAWAARVAAAWAACRAYYAATAVYEDLSRLSDAELARRGLDRATLAREACAAAEADRDEHR
jgi:hypothetical protein